MEGNALADRGMVEDGEGCGGRQEGCQASAHTKVVIQCENAELEMVVWCNHSDTTFISISYFSGMRALAWFLL